MEETEPKKLLGKKRQKKTIHKNILETINIDASKKKILEELKENSPKPEQIKPQSGFDFQKPVKDDSRYYSEYNLYITECFNQRCISFIIAFIQHSQSITDEIRLKENLFKQMINIVKQLMMNEYEIVLFTLYIDEIGWETEEFEICEHLFYIGILTKFLSNQDASFLVTHFKVKKRFDKWYNQKQEVREGTFFDYKTINRRYKELSKPYNCYCKKDYIDYNCVVDKIIFECQPYGKEWQQEISRNEFNIFNRMYKKASRKKKKGNQDEDEAEIKNLTESLAVNEEKKKENDPSKHNSPHISRHDSDNCIVPRQKSRYSNNSEIFQNRAYCGNFQGLNMGFNMGEKNSMIDSMGVMPDKGHSPEQLNKKSSEILFTPFFPQGNPNIGFKKEASGLSLLKENSGLNDLASFNINMGSFGAGSQFGNMGPGVSSLLFRGSMSFNNKEDSPGAVPGNNNQNINNDNNKDK